MKYEKVLVNGRTYTRQEQTLESIKCIAAGSAGFLILILIWLFR